MPSFDPNIHPERGLSFGLSTGSEISTSQTSTGHRYVDKTGSDKTIKDQGAFAIKDSKRTIAEIVTQTQKEFSQAKSKFKNNELTIHQFVQQTAEISKNIDSLIQTKEKEHHSLARTIALVISVISSIVFIGIPFVILIKLNDKDFQKDMNQLKQAIPQDKILSDAQDILEKMTRTINTIPKFPEKSNAERHASFNKSIEEYYRSYLNKNKPEMVPQCSSDLGGSTTIKRTDETFNIHDSNPQPSLELNYKERVEAGQMLIKSLLKTEADQRFEIPLQLIINQGIVDETFGDSILAFTNEAFNHRWGASQEHWLQAKFSGQQPSINLKIIRNPDTNDIEKIFVDLEGSLDITTNSEQAEIILKDAIKGRASFTMTLEDNNPLPILSDFKMSVKNDISHWEKK